MSAVEKVKAGTRFFMYNGESYPSIREIDIFNKDRYVAEQLADVEKSSLKEINGTAYRYVLAARKRIDAASKARAAKAKNCQKKLKKKELEKARELLKEAGEL